MKHDSTSGFTLVEIIVVTAIIGLLTAFVILPILNASKMAEQKAKNRNIADVEKAKGQLTLPAGSVRGAMGAGMDTPITTGSAGHSNLLIALSITNLNELTVARDPIDQGTMSSKASYPKRN